MRKASRILAIVGLVLVVVLTILLLNDGIYYKSTLAEYKNYDYLSFSESWQQYNQDYLSGIDYVSGVKMISNIYFILSAVAIVSFLLPFISLFLIKYNKTSAGILLLVCAVLNFSTAVLVIIKLLNTSLILIIIITFIQSVIFFVAGTLSLASEKGDKLPKLSEPFHLYDYE